MLQQPTKLHCSSIFAVLFFIFSTHLALAQCGEIKILSASVDQADINQGTITLVFENETDLEDLTFHIFLSYNASISNDPWSIPQTWSISAPSNLLTTGEHTWEITEHQGAIDFIFDYLLLTKGVLESNCNASLPIYSSIFPVGFSAVTNELPLAVCRPYSNEHSQYLADGAGFAYLDTIFVDAPGQVVDDLEVYLNMGHTYVGDLSISLKSPEGTTVELLTWPNPFGGTSNVSGFFKDSYPLMGLAGINQFQGAPFGSYLKGQFQPDWPLSNLDGEQLSGPWVLTIIDNLGADDGYVFDWCVNPDVNYDDCDRVASGNIYLDDNGNSVYDENDELLAYELIGYSGNSILFSDANGQFSICDPDSGAYIFNLISPPYATPLVDTLEITYTTDSLANVSQHYGYSIIENASDLSACGNSTGFPPPRPGFLSTFSTYYAHNGTACAYDVVLTATLTGPVQGTIATSNPNAVITGQTITLEFDSLCPGDWGGLEFDFTVPDTVSLGFQYGLDVSISSSNPDFNPDDNTCFSQATVVAAYDPNDKQVNRSTITPEEVADEIALTYTIRFQNTGNFYAERVVLVDTLPDFLDPLSFQFLETSDPMEISMEDQVLKFTFNDIYLPTEADDPEGSIGYVSFSMRVKPNMLLGDSVANQVGIYFDFNAPIITNFAVTTVDEAVSVSEVSRGDVRVFPNPTRNACYLEGSEAMHGTIYVSDLSGRIVHTAFANGNRRVELNLGHLEAGVYLVGSESLGWKRVILQK